MQLIAFAIFAFVMFIDALPTYNSHNPGAVHVKPANNDAYDDQPGSPNSIASFNNWISGESGTGSADDIFGASGSSDDFYSAGLGGLNEVDEEKLQGAIELAEEINYSDGADIELDGIPSFLNEVQESPDPVAIDHRVGKMVDKIYDLLMTFKSTNGENLLKVKKVDAALYSALTSFDEYSINRVELMERVYREVMNS